MLAIFDIDGTICDSRDAEALCFASAFERVTGSVIPTCDWSAYTHATSSGIIRQLLAGRSDSSQVEKRFEREYLRLLREASLTDPDEFSPIEGACSFIDALHTRDVAIAFATGCFTSEARFKLESCGVRLDDYPFATSSDTFDRAEIIPLAARRAGFGLHEVIYFGDAVWDVWASSLIGVRMIGVGRRIDQLKALGVTDVFPNFIDRERIYEVLKNEKKPNQALRTTPMTRGRSERTIEFLRPQRGV